MYQRLYSRSASGRKCNFRCQGALRPLLTLLLVAAKRLRLNGNFCFQHFLEVHLQQTRRLKPRIDRRIRVYLHRIMSGKEHLHPQRLTENHVRCARRRRSTSISRTVWYQRTPSFCAAFLVASNLSRPCTSAVLSFSVTRHIYCTSMLIPPIRQLTRHAHISPQLSIASVSLVPVCPRQGRDFIQCHSIQRTQAAFLPRPRYRLQLSRIDLTRMYDRFSKGLAGLADPQANRTHSFAAAPAMTHFLLATWFFSSIHFQPPRAARG